MPLRAISIGYARPGYGFGRVLDELGRHRPRDLELHHVDLGEAEAPWATRVASGVRLAHDDRLTQIAAAARPNAALIMLEPWLLEVPVRLLREGHPGCRLVGCCPLDGAVTDPRRFAGLADLDAVIVYTQFAARELRRVARELGWAGFEDRIIVIPHGVSTDRFFPLADRAACRRRVLGRDVEGTVILNANRNTSRKRLDLTIEGFARARGQTGAAIWLCLHSGVRDHGGNLAGMCRELGVEDRVLFTTSEVRAPLRGPEAPDEFLNEVYNACDVGVNTSTGEGWGLVAWEHAATGAAQIAPAHTACEELWAGAAVMLPAVQPHVTRAFPIEGRVVEAQAVADAIALLVASDARRQWSALAHTRVREQGVPWPEVAQRIWQVVSG